MNISDLAPMTCDRIVILAAGRASRMKRSAGDAADAALWVSDAQNRPKPMIRVGPNEEPMIQFILEQALRAGFTEATLVIAPSDEVTEPFLKSWNETRTGLRMRIRCVMQDSPLGTGDAVRSALQKDPVPSGKTWILCNGDNLPTRSALAQLRTIPAGQAVLAYDRRALGLDPAKTMAFAILEGDGQSIHRIIEKPSEEEVARLAAAGPVRVSMNIFRLHAETLMPFLEALEPHAERGELELPTALQAMMDAGHNMGQWDVEQEVLDLTRLQDVDLVQKGLHLMEPFQLEVCASTPEDVRMAAENGAHQVELCAHWECGGLTSPESDIRMACSHGIPVHALIRCRAGHFVYSAAEKELMKAQIQGALDAGASRVVVGGLLADGRLDAQLLQNWANTFGPHRLVVHRALDACLNQEEAMVQLAEIGIRRILTSGGETAAWAGRERIEQWMKAGFHVTVGSGVGPEQRDAWMELGVRNFHASCRQAVEQPTRLFDGTTHPVNPQRVRDWFGTGVS